MLIVIVMLLLLYLCQVTEDEVNIGIRILGGDWTPVYYYTRQL